MNQLILYNYRANAWCFTVQNYDEEVKNQPYEIFQKLNLKNMVYGKEENYNYCTKSGNFVENG